jgi:hypothetical protein
MLRRCRISDVQSWLQEKIKAGVHVVRRKDLGDWLVARQLAVAVSDHVDVAIVMDSDERRR